MVRLALLLLVFAVGAGCGSKKVIPPEETEDVTPEGEAEVTEGPACADWCSAMQRNCTEDAIVPRSRCMDICENPDITLFEPGFTGETDTNTLACRIHHAEAAASLSGSARLDACAAAHASGGNICGTWCEAYCQQSAVVCSETNPDYTGDSHFEDEADCLDHCAEFSQEVLAGIGPTDQQFTFGNTVQCRLLQLHTDEEFNEACLRAGPGSTEQSCSNTARPTAQAYCELAVAHCTSDNDLFPESANVNGCLETMAEWVGDGPRQYRDQHFDSFADSDTNSLGCLHHWIGQAAGDPETYCPLADWNPEHWEPIGEAVCHP